MKPYRQKPYQVAPWLLPAIEVLRPRERVTVSQWAERDRVLDANAAMPGPWRNSVTPYLVGIMDAFQEPDVEKIVFVKPTQVGGTAAMENMIGYAICEDPAPALVVYPSDKLVESTVEARIEPMVEHSTALAGKYRKRESTAARMKFSSMYLYLTGANSPANLASKAIRYLFLDEVDKYPGASKREADPVSLAIERTKTFVTNRKIYMASTPTLKSGHIWRAKEAAEEERHYFVPCPHCHKEIELKFAQLQWPSKDDVPSEADRAARAVYVCQSCGAVIEERDKMAMLRAGRWKAVRTNSARPSSVCFWLNTLYSPFTSFAEIVKEFLVSKDDPEKRQNFVNSWLAEPWEDTNLKTNADMVLERQTAVPEWVLPDWTQLVTAGVDVQETCLYWSIRAWGSYMTSQNVAHGQALSFDEIEQIMNRELVTETGGKRLINLALIDSGDQTDDVYEFCYRNSDWAYPSKGMDTMLSHYRLSTVDKAGSVANGMTLVLMDVGKYKDMIAARMKKPNGRGSWMVHDGCDLDYAKQVTAEHKVAERKNGKTKLRWEKKTSHADNHYLDCEVGAAAAADLLGVRALFLQDVSNLDTGREPPPKPPEQTPPAEPWLQYKESWV